jgi:DNA-binding GntR family transcriptional regulator
VYEDVRSRIVALELPPGAAVSEAELATRLEVSRTPVREAIILLADEGLLDVYPQRGTFVTPINRADVVTAQFIRESLECASLTAFPQDSPPHVAAELRGIVARQRLACELDDEAGFFELDALFHQRLMGAAGHEAAWQVVARTAAHLDRVRRMSLPQQHRVMRLVDEHDAVLDAALAGDGAAAVDRLRAHLRLVLDDVDVMHRAQPELFGD